MMLSSIINNSLAARVKPTHKAAVPSYLKELLRLLELQGVLRSLRLRVVG